ncbi:MAG: hypothetical protein BGO03_17680 [Mesorhizobium sp. 61-13]|nr:MAG: hypothetical protein BGO03_17680 [Mesorhizobium sp. 61-13]
MIRSQTATSHWPFTRAKPTGLFCGVALARVVSIVSCVMHVTPGPTPPGEQSPSFRVALASEVPVKRRWRRTAAIASSSVGCATPATAAADDPPGEIMGRAMNPAPNPTTRHPAATVPIALAFMSVSPLTPLSEAHASSIVEAAARHVLDDGV